jgi:hypothetical protein
LAGRTPHEALQNFLTPLTLAISCVTNSQIVQNAGRDGCRLGKTYALAVGKEATFRASADPLIFAEISMQFMLVQVPERDRAQLGRYKVKTIRYRYGVHDHKRREKLSYHWHPGVEVDFPHLHVADLEKCHLPTGRISIEEFIWLLFDGFAVKPKKQHEWEKILATSQQRFKEFRTWG